MKSNIAILIALPLTFATFLAAGGVPAKDLTQSHSKTAAKINRRIASDELSPFDSGVEWGKKWSDCVKRLGFNSDECKKIRSDMDAFREKAFGPMSNASDRFNQGTFSAVSATNDPATRTTLLNVIFQVNDPTGLPGGSPVVIEH